MAGFFRVSQADARPRDSSRGEFFERDSSRLRRLPRMPEKAGKFRLLSVALMQSL
jgi:hypothetical protein